MPLLPLLAGAGLVLSAAAGFAGQEMTRADPKSDRPESTSPPGITKSDDCLSVTASPNCGDEQFYRPKVPFTLAKFTGYAGELAVTHFVAAIWPLEPRRQRELCVARVDSHRIGEESSISCDGQADFTGRPRAAMAVRIDH